MDDYSSSTPLSFLNNSQLFTESTNILEKAGLVLEKAGLTLTPSDDPVKSIEETFLLNDNVSKTQAEEKTFMSSSISASTSTVSSKQQTPLVSAKEASSKSICQSASGSCTYAVVKGFKYCQYHLFEDTRNSFEKCSYISPTTNKQCTHPVISLGKSLRCYCYIDKISKESSKKNSSWWFNLRWTKAWKIISLIAL